MAYAYPSFHGLLAWLAMVEFRSYAFIIIGIVSVVMV
jgi:hypothetical protein